MSSGQNEQYINIVSTRQNCERLKGKWNEADDNKDNLYFAPWAVEVCKSSNWIDQHAKYAPWSYGRYSWRMKDL